MAQAPPVSGFRVEKTRVDATLTLSNGDSTFGSFFVATASAHYPGAERVEEVLNAEPGFFPFEHRDGAHCRTVLHNRSHIVMVALNNEEEKRDPGYDIAARRFVSVLLSNGRRVTGAVRIYRPEGHDRLSDWARHSEAFRYVELGETTLLVNIAHIIEVNETPEP
jgi:hypothetical protein